MLDEAVGKSYIAGPSAGREDNGFPAFRFAERILRLQGLEDIVNPIGNCSPEEARMAEELGARFKETSAYAGLLEKGVRQVLECVRIFMLPGWNKSTGARLEYNVARLTGRWVYSFQYPSRHILLHRGLVLYHLGEADGFTVPLSEQREGFGGVA